MKDPIPQCIDTAKELGRPWPDSPIFICQECGSDIVPKMSEGELTDITCKCGQSYNDELAKYGSDVLLGR